MARTGARQLLWDSEAGARGSLETIQPLWRAPLDRHLLFVQGRFAFADGDETLNLGLGWRHLPPSGDWILGVDGFYDRSFGHDHQRLGFGLEAIGRQLTFRANGYLGVSGWQEVGDGQEERALDGLDGELEGPLPWMPWARVAAGYYFWKRRTGRDLHGFRGRARLQLTPQLSLETGYAVDRDDDAGFVQLRVRLAGGEQVEHAASRRFWSDRAFEPRDLRRHTLAFVERSNEIAVERRATGVGGGRARVIVARGS